MRNVLLLSTSALILAGAVLFGGRRAESTTAEPLAIPPRTVAQFYKGNLHTHTLWSDGDDYPEMVADWYKRHGYQFLALTDHNVLSESERWIDVGPKADKGLEKYLDRFGTTWVERREFAGKNQVRLKPLREFRSQLEVPNRFLLIPAEEISASHAKLPVHLNGINLRDAISPAKADGVAQTIDVHVRAVAAQRKKTGWPMLASLNHPNFGWGVRAEDMAGIEGLQFFEVFNGHPSVRNQGDASHANVERVWDIVLALRLGRLKLPPVYGLATDDAHGYHEFGIGKVNPGRGWVMVRAGHLTAEAIVRGLEAGDSYSSTGVTLDDVTRSGDEIRLQIRGVAGVTYKTQFIATMRDAPLDSERITDKDGAELTVTRRYSPAIGQIVAEVDGLSPKYEMTGKELYVRAKIVSSKPHPNPYAKGDVESAWTQPVVP